MADTEELGIEKRHDMHRTFSYALSILLNAIFFTVPGLFVGTALTNAIDRWYRTESSRNLKTVATR